MDYRVTLSLVLLFFIASVDSYCDPITDVCKAAGLSCPDTTINSCTISGSSENIDLNHYDVICYGFLYLTSGYIKGRVSMGHDFNPEDNKIQQEVDIGEGLDSSDGDFKYSFLCASDVAWPVGQLYPPTARAIYSGRNYGFPDNLNGRVDQCPSGSSCLNSCSDHSERYYGSVSDLFASQTATATTSVSGGTLTITCSSSRPAYFITISSSSFNQVTGYALSSSCNSEATYVFNINAGSEVTFSGTPFSATGTIYNIRGSTSTVVNIKADVRGTIINNKGDMKQTGGVLYGWLISAQCRAMQKVGRPICAGSSTGTSTSTSGSTGGNTTSTGATGTATGATSTSTTSTGATSTSTGATSNSTGATSTSTGGNTTSTGATSTSTGTTSNSTGATSTSTGGNTTSTGATSTSTGGNTTSTGATSTSRTATGTATGATSTSTSATGRITTASTATGATTTTGGTGTTTGCTCPSTTGSTTGTPVPPPNPTPCPTPNCPFVDYDNECAGVFSLGSVQQSFRDYDVIVFGDFAAETGDVEGRLLVFGSVTIGDGFSIGYKLQDLTSNKTVTYALIGDSLNFTSGAVYPDGAAGAAKEYIFVADGKANVPSYLLDRVNGSCSNTTNQNSNTTTNTNLDCLRNIGATNIQCYMSYQEQLSQQADNVQFRVMYSTFFINCTSNSSETYYMTVSASVWNKVTSFNLMNCADDSKWVININFNAVNATNNSTTTNTTVTTDMVNFRGGSFPATPDNVLYNILGMNKTIYVNTGVNGAILSPGNKLNQTGGVINGKVIVGSAFVLQINRPVCMYMDMSGTCPNNGNSTSTSTSTSTGTGDTGMTTAVLSGSTATLNVRRLLSVNSNSALKPNSASNVNSASTLASSFFLLAICVIPLLF